MTFHTHSYGKWILSGEHTVLRGGHALAFPVFSRKMSLSYESGEDDISVQVEGEHKNILDNFLRVLLQRGCEILGRSPTDFKGTLKLHNEIPIGTGLGASAALAVNLAKFFVAVDWCKKEDIFKVARELENVAHGKSSGVDIATIISATGTFYQIDREWENFDPEWIPKLYLHYSGTRGLTAASITKVEELITANSELGCDIDTDMKESVRMCKDALRKQKETGFKQLCDGIDIAESCFERWNLLTPELQSCTQWLKSQGAFAVKPVGSGGGGYLVSLWHEEPPMRIREKLIPCFH